MFYLLNWRIQTIKNSMKKLSEYMNWAEELNQNKLECSSSAPSKQENQNFQLWGVSFPFHTFSIFFLIINIAKKTERVKKILHLCNHPRQWRPLWTNITTGGDTHTYPLDFLLYMTWSMTVVWYKVNYLPVGIRIWFHPNCWVLGFLEKKPICQVK